MSKLKITVLKKLAYPDLAREYCGPDMSPPPCRLFTEGQEFVLERNERPEGFCGWAWHDLHKTWLTLRTGGGFGHWMKDDKTAIRCCTDGIQPIVFKLELLDD